MASETIDGLYIRIEIKGVVRSSTYDGAQQTVNIVREWTFSDGTGTDQVGQVFYDASRTLNATNEDLDVSGSTQKDGFGGALDMTGLKVIYVENLDTDTGDTVKVKQPASHGVPGIFLAAGDGLNVLPNGAFFWISPGPDVATVTAGTGDLINVETADNSSYRVLLAGKNA